MENNKMSLTNNDAIIMGYMSLLNHLSIDLKLKLISKLTESITFDFEKTPKEKTPSWKSLFGVWADMDENLADVIRASRMPEREVPNFDQ